MDSEEDRSAEAANPLPPSGGVWRGRLPEPEPARAGPPYQVLATDFLVSVVEVDPAAARACLPPGLEPSERPTGIIGCYRGEGGPALGAYSGSFLAIEARGHGLPEGSTVFVNLAGWYTGRAGRVLHDLYDSRLLPGEVHHRRDGDVHGADCGPDGRPFLSVELRQTGPEAPLTSGTHHYVGTEARGGLNLYSITFSQRFMEAECRRLEIRSGAPSILKALEPRSLFCYYSPTAFVTFGRPQPLASEGEAGAAEAARLLLLDVFLRLGRAAAVIGRGGKVLYLNRKAEALAGDGFLVTGQHLRAPRAADQAALAAAIDRAFAGEQPIEPIALPRSGRSAPLLARAMPMDAAAIGEKAVLVLFTDPSDAGGDGVVKMLRLLGLAPAEARIALLIGTGLSPKRAAIELNLAESTIRSALKAIYDKLAIHRQSELAQIVARLEAL